MSNAPTSPWAPPGAGAPVDRERATEALTATILAAVERQLSDHVTTVAAKLDHERAQRSDALADVRAELSARLDELVRSQAAQATASSERLAMLERRAVELSGEVEQRVAALTSEADRRLSELAVRVDEQLTALARRLDEQSQSVDEQFGELRRALGATEHRFDAIDQRFTATDQRLDATDERFAAGATRVDELAEAIGAVDQDAIEQLRQEMSRTVGEATLVRIELDRVLATTSERFDKVTVRMGEIEALLADDIDVSAAVQLERLDELERALAEIDPDQFVRKDPDSSEHRQQTEPSNPPH